MFFRRAASAVASCSLGVVALFACLPAVADTYTPYLPSPDNQGDVLNYGLTSTGTLVLSVGGPTNFIIFTPPDTYTTYSSQAAPPPYTYDNGVACTPTNTGAFAAVGVGRCNGAYQVFAASLDGVHYGLYDGDDPVADQVYSPVRGSFGNFLLNSEGDFAVEGAGTAPTLGDQNFLFIRSDTPEPSSVALLGTGLLSVAGVMRRRMGLGATA